MVKGIIRDGVIYPVDPLPLEWTDGHKVWVEDAQEEESSEDVD